MPAETNRKRDLKDWLAWVGVMISGAGLVWAIIAHFIPASESGLNPTAKPPSVTIATANGAGGVAIMNGGRVTTTVITLEDGPAGKVSPRQ